MCQYPFAGEATEVDTSFTSLGEFVVSELPGRVGAAAPVFDTINFEVVNSGEEALADFKVQLKDHPDGEWYDYLGGTDFNSTTNSRMLWATDVGPHELPAAATGHAHIKIDGAYAFRFMTKAAANTTTVQVRGYGRGK